MMPRRQPRVPSIGFASRHSSRGGEQRRPSASSSPLASLDEQLLDVGEELVQRRVEQADGDGQAVHRLEDALEVGALQLLELGERLVFLDRAVGEDEPLHERQAVAEEHVLGAAEADALGAELARTCASCGRSALVRTFIRRNVSAQPRMVSNGPLGFGRDDRDRADARPRRSCR